MYVSISVILLQLLEIASRTPVVVIYTYHSSKFQVLCSMKKLQQSTLKFALFYSLAGIYIHPNSIGKFIGTFH